MKIDRALIIRRPTVKLSQMYAEDCAKSCEEHNLSYEFIEAVEFLPCDEAFRSVGVEKTESYRNTMGNCCCHSSHIKCWKRIIELDKPCIILEHDAIVKGDVKNIDIPDMAVVTFGHRVEEKDDYHPVSEAKRIIEISKAIGTHAYAIVPNTAKWLWEDAKKNKIKIGVDRWLMMQRKSGLPLYVCDPEQVVCWTRTSTSNLLKKDADNVKSKLKSSVHNYKMAFSPSWLKGFNKGKK